MLETSITLFSNKLKKVTKTTAGEDGCPSFPLRPDYCNSDQYCTNDQLGNDSSSRNSNCSKSQYEFNITEDFPIFDFMVPPLFRIKHLVPPLSKLSLEFPDGPNVWEPLSDIIEAELSSKHFEQTFEAGWAIIPFQNSSFRALKVQENLFAFDKETNSLFDSGNIPSVHLNMSKPIHDAKPNLCDIFGKSFYNSKENEYFPIIETFEYGMKNDKVEKFVDKSNLDVSFLKNSASVVLAPHPSYIEYFNTPSELSQTSLLTQFQHENVGSQAYRTFSAIREALAQGDRGIKPSSRYCIKQIEDLSLNVLTMFANHEGEGYGPKEKSLSSEIRKELGINTDLNISFLMNALSTEDHAVSKSLTTRQKRDLAGIIEAQIEKFKLKGEAWVKMSKDVIFELNQIVGTLDKVMPRDRFPRE